MSDEHLNMGCCKLSLANFVKERRAGLGLSLTRLAMRTNCTKGYLHDIENGKATNLTTSMVCGLASGLQMSAVDLFRIAAELSSDSKTQLKRRISK